MEKYTSTNTFVTKNGTKVLNTELVDCYIIEPVVHGDHRGSFQETFNVNTLKEAGIMLNPVQGNESFTAKANTLRGLHFQTMPMTQGKLVRCVEGAIYDVVVDLREGSPSYKQWIKVELSKENNRQLWVPRGFAHGFITITDNVTFSYIVDNDYSYEHDAGVLWNDPEFGIDWGCTETPTLSAKDEKQPVLKLSKADFKYDK